MFADSGGGGGGFPLVLLDPVLLFHLADGKTGCEVYTSAEKRGQVETQGWTFW